MPKAKPPWWEGCVIYQLRCAQLPTDADGNCIGDLDGITQNSYLEWLGVDADLAGASIPPLRDGGVRHHRFTASTRSRHFGDVGGVLGGRPITDPRVLDLVAFETTQRFCTWFQAALLRRAARA